MKLQTESFIANINFGSLVPMTPLLKTPEKKLHCVFFYSGKEPFFQY